MKKLLFLFAFVICSLASWGQSKGYIVSDSTYFEKRGGNAEVIIENGTRDSTGFLYNNGGGRTIFKRGLIKINDSTYIIGRDTLHTNRGQGTDTIFVTQIGIGSPQIPIVHAVDGNLRVARLVPGVFTVPFMNLDSGVGINIDTTGPGGAAYKAWIIAQYGPPGGGFGTVNVTNSVTGNGSLATPLQLAGDVSSPGASEFYGTDASGTKGWTALSTVLGLDPTLGYGDTAYQKDIITTWDSRDASFSAGFARRFFHAHPDSLNGVFDVGDIDGHGTALFVFMGQKSVGVRADSGFQIGSFGDSRFTQIRNQAALAGSGFVAKFYLPATGNPVDTAATLFDIRAAGGGTFTPTSSSSTITIAGSNFEVTRPNLRPTSTVSAPTTFSLVAGDLIDFIWIDPASAETIQVGTTPTGSDIIPSTALLASSKNNFLVGYRATVSTTLYFQGISSSTVITLIKRQ